MGQPTKSYFDAHYCWRRRRLEVNRRSRCFSHPIIIHWLQERSHFTPTVPSALPIDKLILTKQTWKEDAIGGRILRGKSFQQQGDIDTSWNDLESTGCIQHRFLTLTVIAERDCQLRCIMHPTLFELGWHRRIYLS